MNREDALSRVNIGIRNLHAYHLTPDTVDIKLNQNENPFDWPQDIKDIAAEFCRNRPWNRYPDFIPEGLLKAVAEYAGVNPENIIVGNGSNEILLVLLLALTSTERPLLTCQPTFTVYRLLAKGMGHDTEPVYLDQDLKFDIDEIANACKKNSGAVLLLCTPNNPTGNALSEKEIRRILDNHEGMVILDQAYVEFGGFNAVGLIKEYANLIVTRTFSKAVGAAGWRMGYCIGDASMIAEIRKIKLPYNINFFSDYAATLMLSRTDIIRERVGYIIEERQRLKDFLVSFGKITVYDSSANFILIRVPGKADLMRYLREKNILVRDVSSYPLLDNCLRISIGKAEENIKLIEAIKKYFS